MAVVFLGGQELMDPVVKPPGTVSEGMGQGRNEGSETKEARNEGGTDEETRHRFAKSCWQMEAK